ncbi:MAG: patatin-like phospholipase family protein [Bacilli bacterium]|nr:patatin-like phospholipase family protein [Bacilli bacterium]
MKRALVLSGGGGRGSYQIGVWKALRDLGIKFDIITGTSVGALNGALMVQDQYDLAEQFWGNIDYCEVFSDSFFKDNKLIKNKNKIARKYLNATFFGRGLNIDTLEENLERHLNEEEFLFSKIDYGLILYDLKARKPIMITKREIPEGKLKDFIIASATVFPIFRKKKIGDKYYIDGGYYDNLPINLAVEMGATDIIAVHIGVFGRRKVVKYKDVNITYIQPKSQLGSPLSFNAMKAKRGMCLGYNDAMKVYGKYDGNFYTFKKDSIINHYDIYKNRIEDIIDDLYTNPLINSVISKYRETRNKKELEVSDFLGAIELLGKIFNLDEIKIYEIEEFDKLLVNSFIKLNNISGIINIDYKDYRRVIKKIYSNLVRASIGHNKRITNRLSIFHYSAFIGAIYLYILLREK